MIQVPLTPAVMSALAGLQATELNFHREAERIAAPGDAEPGAQDERGAEDGLDPETLVDALVVQPGVYRANARTLGAADEQRGQLLDVYA